MENLRRLRVLQEVALQGSFSAAATALGMTQPSVSQHMTALERELGTRIVERSVTGARLTPAGEIALRHAARILRAVDAAHRELDGIDAGERAPLRIAAFSTACSAILPAAAGALRRRHVGVEFTLEECDSSDAIDRVRLGHADIAIAFDYAAHPLDLSGLDVRHLADDPLRLAAPERHPAATAAVTDLAELTDEPWIAGTGFACRESLRTVCGAAGFAPRIVHDSNRYPTTLALVAAGHGLALVPDTALDNPPRGVRIQPLQPAPPPRRIWAVTAAEPHDAQQDLLDEVVAHLSSSRA